MADSPSRQVYKDTGEIRSLTAVSLFAGIGGLSQALTKVAKELNIPVEFSHHVDVSAVCQRVWRLNHPDEASKYIIKDLGCSVDSRLLEADIWLLSPPCQPFTKGGSERKDEDPRAKPFIHLVQWLKHHHNKKPKILFIENVEAFQSSQSYKDYLETLGDDYMIIDRLMSPTDIGIPYRRVRFFSLAICRSLIAPTFHEKIMTTTGSEETSIPERHASKRQRTSSAASTDEGIGEVKATLTPTDYLDTIVDEHYTIDPTLLKKMESYKFDIITRASREIGVITGAYGERIGPCGPLVSLNYLESAYSETRFRQAFADERLRRLTPKEILRFHGFPWEIWQQPDDISEKKIYRLLGNSVSVDVVCSLLREGLMKITHLCRF